MSKDKWVILYFDTRNGDPSAEENTPSSPFVIQHMCDELSEVHTVFDNPKAVINRIQYQARESGMVLGDEFPPALSGMSWGEWVEVARARGAGEMRLYVVKVADKEIGEIRRRWSP